ncbi:MAG: hypothetical protein WCR30_02890 [Clostridia bacterium]
MSFFINNTCPIRPGPISGNVPPPCERICIQVKKVFDACIFQDREEDVLLTASGFNPANPVQPLTFVSTNSVLAPSTIENLTIERCADRPNFAIISGDIVITAVIIYTDANGVAGTASSTVTVPFSTTLFFPQTSITPVVVESFASFTSPIGTYIGNNVFQVDLCKTILIKVVGEVELLIPSYGYCPIPECQCTSEDICEGFFNQPLFPNAL